MIELMIVARVFNCLNKPEVSWVISVQPGIQHDLLRLAVADLTGQEQGLKCIHV